MKAATPHGKLLALLCLLLPAAVLPLAALALSPADAAPRTPAMLEAYGEIVPGMTRAEDLGALGFDLLRASTVTPSANAHPDAAAQDCVAARQFCTGYLFHNAAANDIVLLVMNGRVVHKAIRAA